MIELALFLACMGLLAWLVIWASNRSTKYGAGQVKVDTQAQIIRDMQEANEIERTTTVAGAADRLRNSRWVRERSLPAGPADNDQHRRSTDRRDGAPD